ncbi:hypothetical protein A3K29_01780 [Candidatus Collierbacteria bacterium RIFOXYB2_FULL_46_14]|nr:MAG: hypothetical protein A3K29_01780 [Candidatus Collierbacteria bacterium RIFOXYB2_FULL_46_14]OGD75901.1 MAG: hypothetical protein A3K43_01780 [Candidatus Collierbacteria bacterium RIFOXYA2_FULL_46_20]OGD77237.1 MAG: hypothetical protein A3K39_01780 [Candidatus Collierbacteria bacterium RIFOXYC2_FULL_43_15]OGD80527.1 MAG: hypothetical protein A2320_02270 [Pseudomonadales bacterium GWC2_63_15]OGD81959.1 MAG: hypothetical protein A3K36_01780 [Candidatus Collierbacteria bacterium RIFOXYD2_FUL
MKVSELEKRVLKIESRNKKVEGDKAWETSGLRKLLLATFTYLSVGLYMWAIKVSNPWLNAIIPAIGFLLSTLTLPFFKGWWLRRRR